MSVIEKIKRKINGFEISTKITLAYSACFVLLLFVINAAMWIGVMDALYSPAEKTIIYSMKQIKKVLDELETNYSEYSPNAFRGALVTGVVLRVVNEHGEIFIDTDPNYPSIEMFNAGILLDPPLFAEDEWEISKLGSALVYCAKMNYEHDGQKVTLYFFRTITSELTLLDDLATFLLLLDLTAIFLAIGLGYVISRRVLTPIKTMNELAREIAFEKMGGRIPIGEADDELNQLAKTLNEMLDRLQGGINKQQKFVSDASHELRTPAAVIKGYIEFIERYGTTDETLLKENLKMIGSEAQNMQALLENLLFLSRTDQNRQRLNKKILDLDDIVDDVMSKMKTVIKTHKVELYNNPPVKIFGDETTIRQMIRIFLDNAVKYTPAGGIISVSSSIIGEKISLSISDSGIGIAPENKKKIFDRFFRIDSEDLVSEANGSGLGLSIAKWIADSHGITISVDSELGKGTTFTLTIPVAKNFS
ncbi:MAG: HAMP domain-containing histidine kinase, partial [Selenomonadaceae bacterium]|nr:HAMP domain-containing histidine kinase [Selenomonadaceae bacterium]